MCRLFGFRSAMPSGVHHSLVQARNALVVQSKAHPDGWGLAFYREGRPLRARGTGTAFEDSGFTEATALVASQTVVAHVRKASCGGVSEHNCHPFVRGRWTFAHNGDVARWDEVAPELLDRVDPRWRETLEGDTDSERLFLLFLTELARQADLDDPNVGFDAVAEALASTVMQVRALADPGAPKPSVLTLLVTNGPLLAAIHSGNSLYYSSHKTRCPERHACPFFHASCEAPILPGADARHLLVASEMISPMNVWEPVPEDGVVGVDGGMRVRRTFG